MDLVSIALRLEVGLPFAVFLWPNSFLVGIAISIANEIADRYYKSASNVLKKCWRLCIFSTLNILAFAVGTFFHCKFVQRKGTERAFIDYGNIKAAIYSVLFFALTIVIYRLLFLFLNTMLKHDKKSITESQRPEPDNLNNNK